MSDPTTPDSQPTSTVTALEVLNPRHRSLTAEEMRSVIAYNPENGEMTWLGRNKTGFKVGRIHPEGYITFEYKGFKLKTHRVAWLIVTGLWPEHQIDHKNGIRHDNRWCNLRQATSSQNASNSAKSRPNSTGFRGVFKGRPGKWSAKIGVARKKIHLGTFNSVEDAHRAYVDAAIQYHGQFARLS